jgi:DNA-binding transcriptional ArsR family regulator
VKEKKWTVLSNHGLILACLARYSEITIQSLAYKTDLSIRAVQNSVEDLEEAGYLSRTRVGRCNYYQINYEKPLRHSLERKTKVGSVLQALGIAVQNNRSS